MLTDLAGRVRLRRSRGASRCSARGTGRTAFYVVRAGASRWSRRIRRRGDERDPRTLGRGRVVRRARPGRRNARGRRRPGRRGRRAVRGRQGARSTGCSPTWCTFRTSRRRCSRSPSSGSCRLLRAPRSRRARRVLDARRVGATSPRARPSSSRAHEGDAFYAIGARARSTWSGTGSSSATLGPGAHFGEIALLRTSRGRRPSSRRRRCGCSGWTGRGSTGSSPGRSGGAPLNPHVRRDRTCSTEHGTRGRDGLLALPADRGRGVPVLRPRDLRGPRRDAAVHPRAVPEPGDVTRALVVEDALYCGACTPRPDPLDLPELD